MKPGAALTRGLRPGVLSGSVLLVGAVALVAVIGSAWGSASTQASITNGLIYLVAALGLGAFWGNSGIMSLGHAGFMALGAYVGGILTLDTVIKATALPELPAFLRDHATSVPIAILALLGVALVVAIVFGLPLLRMGGSAFVIASYGFLVVVNVVLNSANEWTRGAQTLYGLTATVTLWGAFACAAVAIVLTRALRESSLGLQLRASREDELAARACGINVESRRLQAWILSALPAGVAGFLLGLFLSAFTPATFYLSVTVTLIAMVLVGGLQSVSGVVVGVAVITALLQLLEPLEDGFSVAFVHVGSFRGLAQLGLAVVILATLYLRPAGLVGRREFDEIILGRPRPRRAKGAAAAPARRAGTQTALRAEQVSKSFDGVNALTNVGIEVPAGGVVGLIGPNGSGKTTLLNIISSVMEPTDGRVVLGQQDVTRLRPHDVARAGVGRTFQNIRLFSGLSVFHNVWAAAMRGGGGRRTAEDLTWQLLDEFELSDDAARPAGTLAYGQQRRVEIARALAINPTFLLLDEPAAGMNEVEAQALGERILGIREKYGAGVLVVDHDVRMMMRLCEHITVLNEGHVISAGPPSEVRADPAVIEAYLGTREAAVSSSPPTP